MDTMISLIYLSLTIVFYLILTSSSGGRSHPSAKVQKKSSHHVKPFPSRLNKNVSTTTEKVKFL